MDPRLTRALASFDAKTFVTKHGGYKESSSDKSYEYLLPCPFCGGDRLRWNAQKGLWICWTCNPRRTGDTLALISLFERCDDAGAIDYLLEGYVGGDAKLDLTSTLVAPVKREKLIRLPTIRWPSGVERLSEVSKHDWAWRYLYSRGVTHEQASRYWLGFGVTGRLRGYIIFPVFMDGGMVYWQGRASWDAPPGISKDQRKAWEKATNYRKTLNPTAMSGVATAADVIFNYDRVKAYQQVVICEGPFDVLHVGDHACALLGKAESQAKVERLCRLRVERYTVYFDSGAEEYEAAKKLAAELSPYAPVHIAIPPAGEDAGSLPSARNAEIIANAPRFGFGGLESRLRP